MKNFRLLSLGAALLLGGAVLTSHLYADGLFPGDRGPVGQRIVQGLGLTEEQVAKIKAELRVDKDTWVSLFKNLHQARKGLREAIQSGADESAVRLAYSKVAVVEEEMAVQRARLHKKIKPLLTPEQIEKVHAFEQRVDEFVGRALKNFGDRLEQ